MADILLAEGFGAYSDGNHVSGTSEEILGEQWSSFINTFTLTDRGDGRKWISEAGDSLAMQSGTWSGVTTLSFCARIKPPAGGITSTYGVILGQLYDGATFMGHCSISLSGVPQYGDESGRPDRNIIATCDDSLTAGVENFVEWRIVLGTGTSGSVSFYINGVLVNTVSNIETIAGGTSCTNIKSFYAAFGSWDIPSTWLFGDFIVHVASAPIGDVGIYYLPASADGTDTAFTPSAGADHYAMVDEIGPDGDTTYVESDGTAGHRDSYDTAGISGLDIISVGVHARCRKTSTGTATVLLGAVHGASEDQSAAKSLSEDYANKLEFFDTNPSTAAAWTSTEVSAAELSVEVGA